MDLQFPGYGSPEAIWSLLVSALLGFMIGLERERKREVQGSIFAGIRTFPLIAVFGAAVGQVSVATSPLILFGGFIAITVMSALAYWRESSGPKIGGTTGFAVLVAFALGVLTAIDLIGAGLAGAVIVTGLLSMRQELRDLSNTVTRADLFAVVQFAAVTLIVLPLVPNESFGPFGVWNPRSIWLQVVLISGISFVGYLAMKMVGARRGAALSGVLGGFASSTAVMLTLSRRSRELPQLTRTFTLGALAGSATSIIRLAIIIAIIDSRLLMPMFWPLLALMLIPALGALITAVTGRASDSEDVKVSNPFELKTALEFGVIYALILLVTRAAQEYLGEGGVYLASVLGGIVRPDAIALSLADQAFSVLDITVVVRALTLAVATNCVFKATIGTVLGNRRFGASVMVTLLIAAAAAVAAAWLLPPLEFQLAAAPQS